MSWWSYVEGVARTSRQRDISELTGIDAGNVSRWKAGQIPGPSLVAAFARAYDRPVLESFLAAGFLTPEEANAQPTPPPDYSQLTNKQLLELVERRMSNEGSGGNADSAAAIAVEVPAGADVLATPPRPPGRQRRAAAAGQAPAGDPSD